VADAESVAMRITEQEALLFHKEGRPGKIEIVATKPLTTARDLSLAYSPGVAYPCLHIQRDPATAYDYTAKAISSRSSPTARRCWALAIWARSRPSR